MTSVKTNLFLSEITSRFLLLPLLFLLLNLSGCSTYIASKQDDLLTQIDVWSAENEYGKAFQTLDYVKPTHPQYSELQTRKNSLFTEASDYEKRVHNKIVELVKTQQWAEALDQLDEAKEKYPQSEKIPDTEQFLLENQQNQLASIDQKIMIERSLWMIQTRPIYQNKLKTDPRNKQLKAYLADLDSESESLAQQLTELSEQAIKDEYFITARTRIEQAIDLSETAERRKILEKLKNKAKTNDKKKKQAQKQTHKKKQNSILMEIEKSFTSGNLLKTKQLISSLDQHERENPELIQLEQELERSINYTIQNYFAEANQHYTDGDFHQAISLWEQVLQYDPDNTIATKNIQRAQKVIEKLSRLREKQNN